MSEVVTIAGTYNATIYGTFVGATAHIQTQLGDQYAAWRALSTDDQKRALVAATRCLDRQGWSEATDTFAERDAIVAFQTACYELAALGAEDASVFTAADQGSNIQSVGAGGASITYFSQTSAQRGTAPILPAVVMALVGSYLAVSAVDVSAEGGRSGTGSCVNPFGPCRDFDREEPY